MTEKDYSGATTSKIGKNAKSAGASSRVEMADIKKKQEKKQPEAENSNESGIDIQSYKKAGEIAKKAREFARNLIKKDMLLSEIAEKIEAKIQELDGELAFPVNLSIDDVAAHYSPTLRDEKRAEGLLKVDIGVHVNGCIADLAFSLDLTPEKKHAKLIEASEKALQAALEIVKKNKEKTTLSQIGAEIEKTIKSQGFSPIANLSGHSLDEFEVHSGLTIPNIDNSSAKELGEGAFAIEPFATLAHGSGSIYEAGASNIYHFAGSGIQVRDNASREVLAWIMETKRTLPFSRREIEKKFGSKTLLAISSLKRAGAIKEYPQLVEKNHQVVSQSEASFIIFKGKVEIITE